MAPPLIRGVTRVRATVRPFFNLTNPGGGAISDVEIEHYFQAPLKLSLTLDPAAVAYAPPATGAIAHLRAGAAFATQFLEVGAGAGLRLQRNGPGGYSLAASLRLGSLDGLNLNLRYGYSIVRNYFTERRTLAFSNLMAAVQVPVTRSVSLFLDSGFSFDVWAYTLIGLRHRLTGDGGPGTWFIHGGFGLAWIVDRCQYVDPSPCENSAWVFGPTISIGAERRF